MLNFNMDLQKQDNFSKAFTARQGDAGEQFSVTLFDNQVPYTPANGDVVSLRVVTPSGKFASVAGTMSGNKATFTLNGQVTSEAGYYQRAYVAVSNGTKLRTTQDLIFFSLGNSDINKGQADYYVAELDKLLQQLNEEFDEWLAEREQDYSDLLARIVALTNRVTGLEQDVQDLIDAIHANRINTKNVFEPSRFSKPENPTRRRLSDNVFEINGWAVGMVDNKNTLAMLKPNTTYHTHYIAELMTLNGGELYPVQANAGFALYSGVSGYPTIWIAEGKTVDFKDLKVGDTIERDTTFTTPANLNDTAANYRIVGYARRDVNGVTDMVRIHDMIIQEGSVWTGFQPSANDTLTKYDEDRLRKSILIDPKMTGVMLPTIENGSDGNPTTTVTVNSAGYLDIKNLSTTNRARVYYTATQLGLDVYDSKQPFDVVIKFRSGTTLETIEVGYSGGDNAIIKSSYDWQTVGVTVQALTNNAFCIWLGKGQAIHIQELYIYPAGTNVTTPRVERIEDTLSKIERSTIGNPEMLSNIDLNTMTRAGDYIAYQPINSPRSGSGIYWYLTVHAFDTNNRNYLQIITMRSGLNKRYFRQQVNGTWQEWRQLLDMFSDGRIDTTADDFNNLIETGSFVNTSVTNSPTGAASTSWYLEVFRYGTAGNYILQRCTQISNTRPYTYQRQRFNGTWTGWQKITTDLSYLPVEDAGATKDLNNFGTTSEFMIYNPINAPAATQTWYVEVKGYNSTYCKQTATSTGTADNTYTRQKVNNVWTPWRLITKTTV